MIPTEKILKASDDYASGKSSSEVFSQAHKNDFLAGAKWYEENSKAPELLELIKRSIKEIIHLKNEYKDVGHCGKYLFDCENIIKQLTQQ